jgi:hypothetical protein
MRGRTPPKQRASPPSVGKQRPGETSPTPTCTHSSPPNSYQIQQVGYNYKGGLLQARTHSLPYDRVTRAAMAMASSHRGGPPDVSAYGGGPLVADHDYFCAHTHHGETQTTVALNTTGRADVMTTGESTIPATRSDQSARVPTGQRGETTTDVIVHYSVPAGQRYLPISLGHTVTMIHIGNHNDGHVFEPTNAYLGSNEEGLRYHRSMNESDVYECPLDMAKFGRPVSGPLSSDAKWLVNPLPYDATRPTSSYTANH